MLFASDISKAYSDRTLFSGITLNLAAGDRIALVGPNGSGKTTLMDILAGDTAPETGSISKQRNVTIGYLKQAAETFADKPLLQEVLDASTETNALRDEITATREVLSAESDSVEQGHLLQRLSQLDLELEAAGGDDREYEAKAILSGLGFKPADFLRPMGEFSGGWPGSCSEIPTYCSWTSQPITSTLMQTCGLRSTWPLFRAGCWSRLTTGPFSTRWQPRFLL